MGNFCNLYRKLNTKPGFELVQGISFHAHLILLLLISNIAWLLLAGSTIFGYIPNFNIDCNTAKNMSLLYQLSMWRNSIIFMSRKYLESMVGEYKITHSSRKKLAEEPNFIIP